ncbi:MAG: hypothetical protein LW865_02160 [Betaproteobacteria bacterium]|jgi:hypothetical protein|nr:hypothetical protein [Rhodocyclaceae bacterium]MCE2722080.1 hypothetical protein [Betaproteobacteria bacterium]
MPKTKASSAIPNLWHVCIAWPNGEKPADTFTTTVEAKDYDEAVKACIEEMHESRFDPADDEELDYDEYDSPIDCYPLHEGIVRDLASYGINMTFPEIIAALTAQPSNPVAVEITHCITMSPKQFLQRLESATSVHLPGAGKVDVATALPEGITDNEIAYFTWYVGDQSHCTKLTEGNISAGSLQEDGSFRGCDFEGTPILVMFRDKDDKPLPNELRLPAIDTPSRESL